MSNGGFLIKFNDEVSVRCYECAFSYDEFQYSVNGEPMKPLPTPIKKIEIVLE